MAFRRWQFAVIGATLALGGCSWADEALWPTLTGEEPSSSGESVEIAAAESESNPDPTFSGTVPPPTLGTTQFEPAPLPPVNPTGTFVGQKVVQLSNELGVLRGRLTEHNANLQALRQTAVGNAQRYHGVISAINARLQVGTTPGNPVLVRQWNQAQSELSQITNDINAMNNLATEVASDSSMTAYLLESTSAAYGLSGAIEEDWRQLATMEDEVNRSVVMVDRLLNELSDDIKRQSNYLSRERSNLATLAVAIKNGEIYGSSLSNRAFFGGSQIAQLPGGTAGSGVRSTRPLVVIRFDRPNVNYESALYNAVSQTLQRRPNAGFELVAVSPTQGVAGQTALNAAKAKRNAEKVLRSLTNLGLPNERVRLSAQSSPAAQNNEVHIYVR